MRSLMKTEFIIPIILMLLTACAGTPIARLPADSNPFVELQNLEADIKEGQAEHLDVLSGRSFQKAVEAQKRARDRIAESHNPEPILSELEKGFHYLRLAKANAEKNGPYLRGVLVARRDALQANAQENPRTAKRFAEIDEAVRDDSDNAHKWPIDKVRAFQSRYRYTELMAITSQKMGGTLSQLIQADHLGAHNLAPDTYKRAQVDYLAAEDAISANRKNEEAYQEEVQHAIRSTDVLYRVVEAINQSNGRIDEPAAVKLAMQDQEIKDLTRTVAELRSEPKAEEIAEAKAAPRPKEEAAPPVASTAPVVPAPVQADAAEELQSGNADNEPVEPVAPPPAAAAATLSRSEVAPAPLPTAPMAQAAPAAITTSDRNASAPRYADAAALSATRSDGVVPVPVYVPLPRDNRQGSSELEAQRLALEQRERELQKEEDLALSRGRAGSYSPQFEKERRELARRERELMRDEERAYQETRDVEKQDEALQRRDLRAREKQLDTRSPLGSCFFQREDLCGGGEARPLTRQLPPVEPGWKMDKGNLIARSTPLID